jgi:hypothetical protein
MNRLSTGQIRPEDYVVDPQLVAEAMIRRMVAKRPSAVLVSANAREGLAGRPDQREAVARIDHA